MVAVPGGGVYYRHSPIAGVSRKSEYMAYTRRATRRARERRAAIAQVAK
jgi:hypothetical protein